MKILITFIFSLAVLPLFSYSPPEIVSHKIIAKSEMAYAEYLSQKREIAIFERKTKNKIWAYKHQHNLQSYFLSKKGKYLAILSWPFVVIDGEKFKKTGKVFFLGTSNSKHANNKIALNVVKEGKEIASFQYSDFCQKPIKNKNGPIGKDWRMWLRSCKHTNTLIELNTTCGKKHKIYFDKLKYQVIKKQSDQQKLKTTKHLENYQLKPFAVALWSNKSGKIHPIQLKIAVTADAQITNTEMQEVRNRINSFLVKLKYGEVTKDKNFENLRSQISKIIKKSFSKHRINEILFSDIKVLYLKNEKPKRKY